MRLRRNVDRRSSHFLERWLVPGLLVVIGFIQLYLSHTIELSPWKGGGFGMFAAVDSPSMRVLSAEGISQDNQHLWLDVLDDLDNATRQRIRSLPKSGDLEQIAAQLVDHEVVPMGARNRSAYQTFVSQNPTAQELPIPGLSSDQQDAPVYRLKHSNDLANVEDSTKILKAVRLQWWRVRFDDTQANLRVEALSDPVELGDWS